LLPKISQVLQSFKKERLQRRCQLALFIILALAMILRVTGTSFGLPHTYHPDEGALIMPALRILQTGDFNPHRFDYGSAYIYTLSGFYIPYFLTGVKAGLFKTIQDIPVIEDYASIVRYPFSSVFLAARLFNALLGTLTVLAIYILTKRLLDSKHALVASLLLAVAYLHVRESHFATTDIPMILAVIISLLAILHASKTRTHTDLMIAAFICGLTVSVKYPAMPIVAPLVILFLQLDVGTEHFWLKIAGGILALGVGFLIGTPYALLDLPTFLNWLSYDLRLYSPPGSTQVTPSLQWYLWLMFSGYNACLTIPALLGVPFIWAKIPKSKLWLLFAFPVIFAIQISSVSIHYGRTALPLWPFLALLASVAIIDGPRWIASRLQLDLSWLSAALLVVLILVPGYGSVRLGHLLAQDDVRTRTLQWIEANVPHGNHIVVDRLAPPLSPEKWQVTSLTHVADRSLEWYHEQEVEFIVINQAMRNSTNRTEAQEQRYKALEAGFPLVATIKGPFIGYADFCIWVYQVSKTTDK
jgi:4-amino-4-deoxy-L-arabinose transferase-like glycosyltransferase